MSRTVLAVAKPGRVLQIYRVLNLLSFIRTFRAAQPCIDRRQHEQCEQGCREKSTDDHRGQGLLHFRTGARCYRHRYEPSEATKAVIKTGRRRRSAPALTASDQGCVFARSSIAPIITRSSGQHRRIPTWWSALSSR